MRERLPVVLVHRQSHLDTKATRRAAAVLDRLTEDLVGHLAGKPGIDLVLVAPLSELKDGDPDTLTLESIAGNIAVITRSDADTSIDDLGRIGFSGIRAAHRGDPSAEFTTGQGRRIYAFNLSDYLAVESLVESIEQIRFAQSVKTFSLAPSKSSRVPSAERSFNRTAPIDDEPRSVQAAATESFQSSHLPGPPVSIPENQQETALSPVLVAETVAPDTLDDLIDKLDQADV